MWTCYVIGRLDGDRTYCGMTNNFSRRIRQHNAEITGGARATARAGPGWVPLLTIEGFEDKREALRAEWRLHHPGGHRRSRPGRGRERAPPACARSSRPPRAAGRGAARSKSRTKTLSSKSTTRAYRRS